MNHYLLSFWACWGISDHTHLKQPTNNICCFHRPLVTSKNSVSYLNLFLRYSSLKNTAFWLVQRFLDHNWRTRFLPNILFLEKVKTPLALSYWSKKRIIGSSYRKLAWVGFEPTTTEFRSIQVDDVFFTALVILFFGLFETPKSIWIFFKNQGISLFLLYDVYQIASQGLIQPETTVSRKESIWSKGNKDCNKIKLE